MFGRKAPEMVGDLSDDQVDRWREGDETVWNEDRKGRQLSPRATERRDAQPGGWAAIKSVWKGQGIPSSEASEVAWDADSTEPEAEKEAG
jgi:hypothetical protein